MIPNRLIFQVKIKKIFTARFFKKIQIGFLTDPKESENGFCVLVKRSIQDLTDHGASKEPKNPLPVWILRFL